MGDHYRDTWTKEIDVPYLNLDTAKGDLTVISVRSGLNGLAVGMPGSKTQDKEEHQH